VRLQLPAPKETEGSCLCIQLHGANPQRLTHKYSRLAYASYNLEA
jgi:hypothetical protein